MSTWINNYNEPNPDYDPQLYRGGGYPWKYGGYDGYQGYSGQPGFKRDLGYVNAYQGVGSYYTGPKCKSVMYIMMILKDVLVNIIIILMVTLTILLMMIIEDWFRMEFIINNYKFIFSSMHIFLGHV